MRMMFAIDGTIMLLIALLFIVLVQRDYHTAPRILRAALLAVVLFAFCCSAHLFGLRWHALAMPYWARLGFDTSIAVAVICRLVWGRFIPRV